MLTSVSTASKSMFISTRTSRIARPPSEELTGHGHGNTLHRVVHVAAEVPRRIERLHVPRGIPGTTVELVLAGIGVPDEAPPSPCPAAERVVPELGFGPRLAAVRGHLDPGDLRSTRPRAGRSRALRTQKGKVRTLAVFGSNRRVAPLKGGAKRGSDFAPPAALIAPTAGTLGLTENVTPPALFGVPSGMREGRSRALRTQKGKFAPWQFLA